ncbi:PE family protein [Mycobacterium parmense]|uniref:PE family protein PE4 n=1 Tax=Mycobacterium parmense TaxID=185642 RepID=A0A7I7YX46_9MYCO|nr:PE-PPE domain-containing protein [Mycobacterium parmense]MCV7350086.1 PE-PPE domain-containing protein [Mycobacterium parmense]ORW59408.1 PE family protein [Mycobacterium parmense]BBZ46380.1 PE family protein PE4 [Mycobacterium parmense]
MSYLVTAPAILASTADDVASIGSTISAAGANAAGPTTGLMAAAGDEVSVAITDVFTAYGRQYQAFVSRASAFHSAFTQALTTAANSYAHAEYAGAGLLSSELGVPMGALPGQGTSAGSVALTSAARSIPGDPLYALIMGYTSLAEPDSVYLNAITNAFLQPRFAPNFIQGVFTPEQFWPVTPQLGNLTFGQSLAQGIPLLHNAITTTLTNPLNSAVVFGYSQSATIATYEINALMAAGSPYTGQLSFVLVGNPNNPVGGILERFPGFYIPFLDVAFNGATPPNSPYPTSIFTAQYDGIADLPQYPLNLVSDLNAFMGYFFVHDQYPMMSAGQVANAVPLPTSPGYTGNTAYYMLMTQNLPLLEPIRDIPYAGPPIADIFQPDLRVLVDMGYAGYGPGYDYANIPTPAGLFSVPNPFTIIPDLALGAVQGPYGAAVEIGVESGLASPSLFPDTYPWVPSTDPQLTFPIIQSSTTLLSLLSGGAGSVLDLIPAPNFG